MADDIKDSQDVMDPSKYNISKTKLGRFSIWTTTITSAIGGYLAGVSTAVGIPVEYLSNTVLCATPAAIGAVTMGTAFYVETRKALKGLKNNIEPDPDGIVSPLDGPPEHSDLEKIVDKNNDGVAPAMAVTGAFTGGIIGGISTTAAFSAGYISGRILTDYFGFRQGEL